MRNNYKYVVVNGAIGILLAITVVNCAELMSQKDFDRQSVIETQSVLGDDNVLQQFDDNTGSSVPIAGGNTTTTVVVTDDPSNPGGGTGGGTGGTGGGTGGTGGGTGGTGGGTGGTGGGTGGTGGGTGGTGGGTGGTGGGTGGTPVIPMAPPEVALEVDINRVCSQDRNKTFHWRYKPVSVMENNGLFIRISEGNQVYCQLEQNSVKQQLIDGKLSIPSQCYGPYSKTEFTQKLALHNRDKRIKFQVIALNGTEEVQINDPKKKDNRGKIYQSNDPSWVYLDRDPSNPNCDDKQSPLFVDFRQSNYGEYFSSALSAPSEGVRFDLVGENPKEGQASFAKEQISWFQDANLMFIALPNEQGQILGINELFGNNTKVPVVQDGQEQFAENGFDALARYDENQDGFIDEQDSIFTELRLWSDKNFNGQADAGELYTLSEMGLTYVSLKYDKKHKEMDQYKNEIRYKSAAARTDGTFNLVFDVWFTLPNR